MSLFFPKNSGFSVVVVVVVVVLFTAFFIGLNNASGHHCVDVANGEMYDNNVANDHLTLLHSQVEKYIEVTIDNARPNQFKLIGSVMRLIFHDCGGPAENKSLNVVQSICDGCIDFENTDAHAGLQDLAVIPLEMMYDGLLPNGSNGSYPQWCSIMSRADFWAAASTIALKYAQELCDIDDTLPEMPFYFGRKDCIGSPDVDTEAVNYVQKEFPNPEGNWTHVKTWFATNLGFSENESVVILGAHTVGNTHKSHSGFTASNKNNGPWVVENACFDNQYFIDLTDKTKNWTSTNNGGGKWFFLSKNHTQGINNFYIMLNVDGAIIAEYGDDLFSTGRVNCFLGIDCADNDITLPLAKQFANNNQLFLNSFAPAFLKMITTGYDIDNDLIEVFYDEGTSESESTDAGVKLGSLWLSVVYTTYMMVVVVMMVEMMMGYK